MYVVRVHILRSVRCKNREKICAKENNHTRQYLRDSAICLRPQSWKNFILLKVLFCFWERKLYCHILYFSLRIIKFLQLCERRQIAEPRKYCLVWLFFFGVYFSLFLHLTNLRISYIFSSWKSTNLCCVHGMKFVNTTQIRPM